jgi:hypothetical protein
MTCSSPDAVPEPQSLHPLDLMPQLAEREIERGHRRVAVRVCGHHATLKVERHRAVVVSGNARVAGLAELNFGTERLPGESLEAIELALRRLVQRGREVPVPTADDDVHAVLPRER